MPRTPTFRKPPPASVHCANAAGLCERVTLVSLRATTGAEEPERETSMLAFRSLATTLCLLASGAALADDPLPRAKPEEVGMSSERLARIGAVLKADIEAGRIPGAVIAIARHGKLVALDAYGWRDKAADVAMATDTIFNIASMTKPMATVGAL